MEEIMNKLNYQPVGLSLEEIENPEGVISCFFSNFPIHESREKLWELFRGWTYHSAEYSDTEETRNMMSFYTNLMKFINASCAHVEQEKFRG